MTHPRSNTTKLVFGLAVVALGVLFTLHNLELVDADDYFIYWPVLLIAVGLANLVSSKRQWAFVGVTVGIGLWILLYNLEVTDLEPWPFFWPAVLVLIGTNLVLGALRRPRAEQIEAEEVVNSFAVWSGIERKVGSPNFQGGDLTAIMGGCEIDLRDSKIVDGTPTLHVFAFWGGIDVVVPKEWRVDFRVLPLLGGAGDETRSPESAQAPTLVVRGMAIMGGVDVKN